MDRQAIVDRLRIEAPALRKKYRLESLAIFGTEEAAAQSAAKTDEAQKSEVLRLILLDGLRPVVVGSLVGLAGGAVAGAFMRSILYGISPLDPFVFSTMIVSLLLTAIAACALPALRAVRIEPMQALRAE